VKNCSKQITLTFLVISLLLSGCERTAGRLIREDSVKSKDMTFLLQLYPVANYPPEREVVVWCTSAHTKDQNSQSQARSGGLEIDSDGRSLWLTAHYGPFAGSKDAPVEELPKERVHIVTSEFAFVDLSPGSIAVTFDACKAVKKLGHIVFFEQLFRKNELKLRGEFRPVAPPAFVDFRIARNSEAVCFRLNPIYVNEPYKGFDVCTSNGGATWYSKIANGALSPPTDADLALVYSDTLQSPTYEGPVSKPITVQVPGQKQ
jgi:hypothetical protein